MKKILCIIMAVALLMSLCACQNSGDNKTKETIPQQQTVQKTFNDPTQEPTPAKITYEESTNRLGARYVFTLEEFNTMLNDECKKLGGNDDMLFFDFENWVLISDSLVDENGVFYESYYYNTDVLTMVASIEKDSKKVMNLGCGVTYKEFLKGDADYQYNIMLTSSIIAMVAGGYQKEDLEFIYSMFSASAKDRKGFSHNNSMYMFNQSKMKDDDVATAMFTVSPCSVAVQNEWELIDYTQYNK